MGLTSATWRILRSTAGSYAAIYIAFTAVNTPAAGKPGLREAEIAYH